MRAWWDLQWGSTDLLPAVQEEPAWSGPIFEEILDDQEVALVIDSVVRVS